MIDNESTPFSDGMQRLHDLLYTAQTSTGDKQIAAVNEARIVLYRLRNGSNVQPQPVQPSERDELKNLLRALLGEPDRTLDQRPANKAEARRILASLESVAVAQAKPEQAAQPTQAAIDVLAERQRQISTEGWTLEHDDEHSNGELSRAAATYALNAASQLSNHPGVSLSLSSSAVGVWPFDHWSNKPSDERRNLIKAGALILAEIERLDRAAPQPKD